DEYLGLAQGFGAFPFRRSTFALVVLCFALLSGAAYLMDRKNYSVSALASHLLLAFLIVLLAAALIFLLQAMGRADLKSTLPAAAFSVFALAYILLPLASLVALRMLLRGWFFVLFIFFVVWAGDIGAYYIGKNFGTRKLAPHISPNKSWEGAITSFLVSVLIGLLLNSRATFMWSVLSDAHLLTPVTSAVVLVPAPAKIAALLAAIINLAAQLGDLAESMLKRGAGVKDSGKLVPGHGGVLDRIDALLFAAPVGMVLFVITARYFTPVF
ncbi:MAG TPA: phosphatidate cytidylyltransferase, partial [Candidatus Angelobacter sp.]|nr:phosphatidate cytidylyltransferase [Candidatus Angelobacter sp.]